MVRMTIFYTVLDRQECAKHRERAYPWHRINEKKNLDLGMDHVQVNCRLKVNCRKKIGFGLPTVGWASPNFYPTIHLYNCNSLAHDLGLSVCVTLEGSHCQVWKT